VYAISKPWTGYTDAVDRRELEYEERARQQKIPGYSYLAAVRGAPSQWLQREEEPAPSNKDS